MFPEETYIAFFDVDHTIIRINSGKILVREARRKGLIPGRYFLLAIYFSLLIRIHLADPRKVMARMARWVKGLSGENMTKLSDEIVELFLIPAIYSQIIAEIHFHKEQKARVVILSSAIRNICVPLAKHLGFDDVICSELEIREGAFTGRFAGNVCYAEEKVNRLRHYCEEMNLSPSSSYYYGDSISDFQVLNSVGHPICVNPDKKLAGKARPKQWRICHWL